MPRSGGGHNTTNYLLPERLDRLAREYALGTLAGPARRRFERVLHASRAAAMAVDVWRERLAVLDLAVVPIPPPVSNWRGIERRLFADAAGAAPAITEPGRGAWHTLLGWLSGRMIAGALAGVLLCFSFVRLQPGAVGLEPAVDAVSPSYIGLLLDKSDKAVLVVSSRRQGRQLTIKLLQPIEVPSGQVAQLWALPKNAAAPFPIGVLPKTGSARSTLPDTSEKLFANVSQIALSFEDAEAKPGAVPSGAFVLKGNCVKVW